VREAPARQVSFVGAAIEQFDELEFFEIVRRMIHHLVDHDIAGGSGFDSPVQSDQQ
jgi:hypothetical protein